MTRTPAPTSKRSGRGPHSSPATARRKPAARRQLGASTGQVKPGAILIDSARVFFAELVAAQPLYLAWGAGSRAPGDDASATSLVNELGRRKISDVSYAVPDLEGIIVTSGGRYSASNKPTRYLFLKTSFDFADAHDAVIRETAVFAGSNMIDGLPSDQRYFTPAEVASAGRMLTLERQEPIYRSPAIHENFEMVIEF